MSLWALWGKTRRGDAEGDETHALVHHMIEVGAVAGALWDRVVARAIQRNVRELLDVERDGMRKLLAWLASLHDVGKASPAFQAKYQPAIAALQAAGLHVEAQGSAPAHHSAIGHAVLLDELPRLLAAPPRVVRGLAAVLGGHHGVWQRVPPDIPGWELGDRAWADVRRELVDALTAIFAAPLPQHWPPDDRSLNTFLTTLAGLVTMADWLGSMSDCFPCRRGPSELAVYLAAAAAQVDAAVQRLLPGRLPEAGDCATFERMFPFAPNEMQRAAIDLAGRMDEPALVIIEAPTGCGKTEAALYLAERLRATQSGAGTYVAMPTMTTSNQMHRRVSAALHSARPDVPLRPLLVHGQAIWQAAPPVVTSDEAGGAVDPMAWFLPRKRSLLAPYGVGTVDQALLSVLPTTHFYLRLYGLAAKTVVFDEVHAYDTYMSALFERLLGWLHALGSSVVILSATLPAATRRRLLDAYGAPGVAAQADASVYPAVTWRCGAASGAIPLEAAGQERDVSLRWLARDALLDDLRARLREGGCAAVICNTVGRAQDTYLAIKEAALVAPEELYLFHARYPQTWRDGIETRVLGRFGKERRRQATERAILVATQVVEQSLDLDFDDMLSDLAPIDLLIQRVGRLHRHPRPAGERPRLLTRPTLTIVRAEAGATLQLDGDGPMYEPYVLLRTLLALEGRPALRTPGETSALIEAVYGDVERDVSDSPEVAAALGWARDRMEQHMRGAVAEAEQRLVPPPQSHYFVGGQADTLREDDPAVHRSLQALTRLAEPSVQVVCLHRHAAGLGVDPHAGPLLRPEALDNQTARTLARHSVAVTHRGAVPALLAQAPPAAWARHPFLRHCRLAVFEDGVCPVAGSPYTLRLTRELGLQVTKED